MHINDIDKENLDIANSILHDSEKIPVNKNKSINFVKRKKQKNMKKYFAVVATAAACFALFFSGLLYTPNIVLNGTGSYVKNKIGKNANSYDEIFNRMYRAYSTSAANKMTEYSQSYGLDDMIAKSSDSNTASGNESCYTEEVSNPVNDYYNTNEQVENVHEADIVKNDGKYIYSLDSTRSPNRIAISKADNGKTKLLSYIDFSSDDNISEIYVYYDYLIALKNTVYYSCITGEDAEYDSINDKEETTIYTYDISDRKNPKLISKNCQDGHYVDSRLCNGYIYTISNYYIDKPTRKKCVPTVNGKLISYKNVHMTNNIYDCYYTVVTSLNIKKSKSFYNQIAITGDSSTVYMSQNNIYIINSFTKQNNIINSKKGNGYLEESDLKIYNRQSVNISNSVKRIIKKFYDIKVSSIKAYKETSVIENIDKTEIIKYSYSNGKFQYKGDSTVDGSCYGNLCLDEKDGYLRFITSHYSYVNISNDINYYDKNGEIIFSEYLEGDNLDNNTIYSNVYVLDEDLKTVAVIDKLAKGEDLYGTRFMGDYGYFVTYENTDPLFSVDFSDITNPKIVGELKMPGFSSYLHLYTEDKLLGVGHSDTYDCIKLEMYDIKKGSASKESKIILKDFYSTSCTYDYKAAMIDSSKNIIGFQADEMDTDNYHYLIYSYDDENFYQLADINLGSEDYDVRGLYIDNYIYVVVPSKGIYSINMSNYNQEVQFMKFK